MTPQTTSDRQAAAPRDPVTGTRSTPSAHDTTPENERAPDELAHDIRRTRADISETIDEIEARLSPRHLKAQFKGTVHETLDEVQDRLDPRHLIHNARRTMIDTIRENPIPSILAGLSLGYLIFNAPDDRDDRRVRGYDRYDSQGRYRGGQYRYDPAMGAYGAYGDYTTPGRAYQGDYRQDDYRHDDSGTLDTIRDRSRDAMDHTSERMSSAVEGAQEHLEQWREDAGHQMHRAKNNLEQFVHDNPLAAGALALGIGALIGGLLPPTPQENRFLGEASDTVTRRIEHTASATLEQGKEAASRVAREARSATEDESDRLKTAAQNVADRVKDVARDEAEGVKQTARAEATHG